MHTVDIDLNAGVFSHSVVIATTHRYSDRFQVRISRTLENWQLRFEASGSDVEEEALRAAVMRDALDEQLRELVRARTAGLHEALINAALSGATPRAEK